MAIITQVKERINQLNQASFQILCDALLSKEGYPGIVALGTKDGAEKTTLGTPDTYFCLCGGKYVFAEYTTQKDGLPAKIRSDIEKCLDEDYTKIPLCQISEIVYCHTSSNIKPADDHTLKAICEEKGIKLTLLGIDLLADMLLNYPVIIKDHLGISIDSEQIQTADDFVKQYDSNAMAATLDTAFLFRDKEIDAINKAFENVSTVLLVGPAGVGKTRLALEYAKNHAGVHNEKLLCIHDRSLPMYEDLKLHFEKPGEYFVFVDDANQLSELEHIIEYANKASSGYHVHILMTVRDYAVSKVKASISGIVHYEVVSIGPFSDDEITSLMKEHYAILNPDYLDRIAQIAEGNARIAMLTGKIACDANRLDAINDVSDLYNDYFGKALHEAGVDSNVKLLVSAGVMAFLNAVHLDHIDSIVPILEEKGLSKSDFEKNVNILHEQEIVDICNDKGVRFSEQCMSNFVLKYVFFDKKVIELSKMIEACFGSYHGRTVHAVNTLLGVFRNEDLRAYVKKEILDLWRKLEVEKSPMFWKFLKTFFPVDEIQALLIIQEHIENTDQVVLSADDINTEEGKNYQSVSDDIITILGGFSHLENLDAALDLYFQYYLKRPDLYMQFYHASTSFFSIDKNSAKHGYRTQVAFIEKLVAYSQHGSNPFVSLLFCGVAGHFLQLEFSPHENTRNGKGITIYHVPVALTPGTLEYRKPIWEFLIALASNVSYVKRIKDILRGYGNAIHDCSKNVIKAESEWIYKLSDAVLSPERLEDCLIAQSLQNVFEAADYQTDKLEPFLMGAKYKLYQLIKGPKWDLDISFEEREQRKKDNIHDYMDAAPDKTAAFRDIFELYLESTIGKENDSYDIASGVNIALQTLADDKDNYISCTTLLLSAESIQGIGILELVKELFSLLPPQKVFDHLSQYHPLHRNEWLYAFYHEIPQNLVTQKDLDGLYAFLMEDSDRNLKSSPYRDIDFLDKYLPLDNNVIYEATKIILKKKDYSPFMVTIYFELQFNAHHICPNDVIQKYARDISLLEQLYLCVIDNSQLADCGRAFLQELFNVDKSFINEYIEWFVKKAEKISPEDLNSTVEIFYQEDEYLEILDYTVDKAIASTSVPSMTVPGIIKQILGHADAMREADKRDTWVKHFIKSFCNDKNKMLYVFEAIAEISVELSAKYIAYLIECTDEYDIFRAIPLTPRSYSCSGSCVPLYSSWVEHLQNLLPLFSGLNFLEHKNRVQQLITDYRKRIKEEEISDILNG